MPHVAKASHPVKRSFIPIASIACDTYSPGSNFMTTLASLLFLRKTGQTKGVARAAVHAAILNKSEFR